MLGFSDNDVWNVKFPFACIPQVCMRDADVRDVVMKDIAEVIAWSHRCMALGTMPAEGPRGEELKGARGRTLKGKWIRPVVQTSPVRRLQLMRLQFEVVRSPVGVVWGRIGVGLGPFGLRAGPESTTNDTPTGPRTTSTCSHMNCSHVHRWPITWESALRKLIDLNLGRAPWYFGIGRCGCSFAFS